MPHCQVHVGVVSVFFVFLKISFVQEDCTIFLRWEVASQPFVLRSLTSQPHLSNEAPEFLLGFRCLA